MIQPSLVIIITAVYLALLFGIAYFFDKKATEGKTYTDNVLVYVLALAIYCTTWTYYGNVGLAVSNGYLFLGVYLGPTLFFIFWAHIVKRILSVKREYKITSLAEFISIRYGKSPTVAALATIIAFIGIVPYLALQLKAILSSYVFITTGNNNELSSIGVGLSFLLIIILFTILFGFRKLDQTEQHPGAIMAVAFQSIVKLVAFLIAGVIIVYVFYDGFFDIFSQIAQNGDFLAQQKLNAPSFSLFLAHILLSMSAILFLPRQFQVTIVENSKIEYVRKASWMLPLYFALITLFVFPIAMAGIIQGFNIKSADLFMLYLTYHNGSAWLSILVFIGGVSAALGMITFETIALTTMTSNHIVLPLIEKFSWLNFLRQKLLFLRWIVVSIILFVAYIFERAVGTSYLLVKIGMISFAAVFQFVPAIIGGIYWKKGSKAGAILGMSGGFLVWIYLSLVPALVKSGWLSQTLLSDGPFGIRLLRPENIFGISGIDPLALVVFFSMLVNISLYIFGSLFYPQTKEEELATNTDFVQAVERHQSSATGDFKEKNISVIEKINILTTIFNKYLNSSEVEKIITECKEKVGIENKEMMSVEELISLRSEAEKILAKYIGILAATESLSQGKLFTENDSKNLSSLYVSMAENLKLSPEEFSQKIDFFKEKERLSILQKEELEKTVTERTKDLEMINADLKKINDLTIGRELKMVELKKKIQELEKQSGQTNQ